MENRGKTSAEAPENADPKTRKSCETPPLSAKQESKHQMTPSSPSLHKQLLQRNLKEEKRALQEEIKVFWGESRTLRVEIKAFQEENKTKILRGEICNFKLRNKTFLEEMKNYLEDSGLLLMEISHFWREKMDFLEMVSAVQEKIEAFQEKIKVMEEQVASFEERNESLQTAVKAFQLKNKEFQESNKAIREKNKSLQEKMEALKKKDVAYWKECKAFWRKDKVFWEEGLAISRDKIALCEEYIALIENDQDLKKELTGMQNMMKTLCNAVNSMWRDISGLLGKHSQDAEGSMVKNGASGTPFGELKMCD